MGEKMIEKNGSYIKVIASLMIKVIVTLSLILFGLKGLMFYMPFLVAWIVALVLAPVVKFLEEKFKIVRKIGSAISISTIILASMFIVYLVGVQIVEFLSRYMKDFGLYYGTVSAEVLDVISTVNQSFSKLPGTVAFTLSSIIDQLGEDIAGIIAKLSQPTVLAAGNFAKQIPSFLVASIITIISTYFFIAEKEMITKWVNDVTPKPISTRMSIVRKSFLYSIGGYFKSQFKIMGVIFVILFVSLKLIGVNYALFIAFIIAILDFFPVLGTGTVLLPWALFQLLSGDYKYALFLMLIYVFSQGVRQFIQPKLIADSVDMNPILALFLLYTGYKVSGVMGMIFAIPLGIIVIDLYEAGAFDYIFDDVKVIRDGILSLSRESEKFRKEK